MKLFGGLTLLFSTAPMIYPYRSARRAIKGVIAAFFWFAGLRLLLSHV